MKGGSKIKGRGFLAYIHVSVPEGKNGIKYIIYTKPDSLESSTILLVKSGL